MPDSRSGKRQRPCGARLPGEPVHRQPDSDPGVQRRGGRHRRDRVILEERGLGVADTRQRGLRRA